MSGSAPSSGPDELSGPLLRALRTEAGLKQTEVVALAGVSQAQLSRIEQPESRSRPSPELTRAILELYATRVPGLTGRRVEMLVEQADALATRHVDARVVLQAGQAHNFQLRTREAERRAKVVRSYHPTTVLGVLQTRAFATAWFTPDGQLSAQDAVASVDHRMKRRDALAEPGRQWLLIQTEQAIRWPVRDYGQQADQIDQMIIASRLPNVHLRIITLDTLSPTPAPLTGFHVYDDHEAVVGTDLGTALVGDKARVNDYLERFAALEQLALPTEASRVLLAELARKYRRRQ